MCNVYIHINITVHEQRQITTTSCNRSVLKMFGVIFQEKPVWKMESTEKIEACERKKLDGNSLFNNGKFLRASKKYDKEFDYTKIKHIQNRLSINLNYKSENFHMLCRP